MSIKNCHLLVLIIAIFTSNLLFSIGNSKDINMSTSMINDDHISKNSSKEASQTDRVTNFSISAGSINGVYYSIGSTMCRLFNKHKYEINTKCSLEATPATIFNLNMLRSGKTNFAIVQGDWEKYALDGTGYFESHGKFTDLRAVFSMHQEVFTVIVRKSSPVNQLDDLRGKRVNLNGPGSGANATFRKIMKIKNWQKHDFKILSQLNDANQNAALCDQKVDAIVAFVGHPNASLQELSAICDIKILNIANDVDIKKMINDYDFYFAAAVPKGIYKNVDQDVNSFGVYANLVTRADVSEELVYLMVQYIMNDLNSFKLTHNLLKNLDVHKMSSFGYSSTLHAGAKKYYHEHGIIK